jgi:hypothetical protein
MGFVRAIGIVDFFGMVGRPWLVVFSFWGRGRSWLVIFSLLHGVGAKHPVGDFRFSQGVYCRMLRPYGAVIAKTIASIV